MLIILSSLPIFLLIFLGPRLSPNMRWGLGVCSIPFFILMLFYALLLGIALFIAFALLGALRIWMFNKKHGKTITIYRS